MTNMESRYGSGKFTEIMQSVKLTAIKKITAEEVEFYTSEERFNIHGQLRKFMKGKNILRERKSLRIGGNFAVPNSRELLWQGSSEKSADITYSKPDSAPKLESLRAVVKKLCSKMLSALDKYFNVDYRVSLVFGTAKSEYTGLAPNIREALIKTF